MISDEPYAYRTVYLSDDCADALGIRRAGKAASTSQVFVPVVRASERSIALGTAHRELLANPGAASREGELLEHLRAILREAVDDSARHHARRDRSLVETAKDVLTRHVGQRVALEHVADTCGVTPYHLIRVFRRVTGLSPYAYLIVLRVNEARRMLDCGASISDAVYGCCFSDQSHLTRIFKRTLGMPPGLYLRAARPRVQPTPHPVLRDVSWHAGVGA